MGIFGGNAPCSGTQPSLIFAHLLVRCGFTSGTAGLKLYWKSFRWVPLATRQWKIRMFWRWCSHEFPMKMGIPWPSVTRKLSTQAGTAFRVNINIISTVPPAVSYSAFPLIHTLAVWSLVMFHWNHQWIPQVRFKSRFWMVKSFTDQSE